MSTSWLRYPQTYRETEVKRILRAATAGDCAAVIGLSGAGKSNLMGFLAHRVSNAQLPLLLIDCNRLAEPTRESLLAQVRATIDAALGGASSDSVENAVARFLAQHPRLCLLLDRFDGLPVNGTPIAAEGRTIMNNLRALRDAHKGQLTLVTATRHPLGKDSELSELLFANTIWLGPLQESDARWNIARFADARGLLWDDATTAVILAASRGYPSLLKALCEAVADGSPLTAMAEHEAVTRRIEEFWSDQPSADELARSGLSAHPLLQRAQSTVFDTTQLTAKEHLLLAYLQAHPNQICDKDELIRAVWSEDKAFVKGIRDDSLAQLVRRLREKIETDPSSPKHILAAPGRGYRFVRE